MVFTDLPSWNLSFHPNNGMDPRRKLLIVIMNRIVQPEILCEDLHYRWDQLQNEYLIITLKSWNLWSKKSWKWDHQRSPKMFHFNMMIFHLVIFHDFWWLLMLFHDKNWRFIVINHDISWLVMTNHHSIGRGSVQQHLWIAYRRGLRDEPP